MTKAPRIKDWQKLKLELADLSAHFNGKQQNIGVLLGQLSNGLADIDLDCNEAVALAPKFLPPTPAIFGRKSNPSSHRLYYSEVPSTLTFDDPMKLKNGRGKNRIKARLLEVRSTGGQTVFPGSVHESGELINWENEGDPSIVDASELLASVKKLSAATLLLRYYPDRGIRQEVMMALAGGLLRLGWTVENAEFFMRTICESAHDEETNSRVETICYTAKKQGEGKQTTGFPKLATLIDKRIVERLRDWLTLSSQPESQSDSETVGEDNAEVILKKSSQGKRLIALAKDIELFHTAEGKPYATVEINGHSETMPLTSKQFRDLLSYRFYLNEGTTPSNQGLQDALGVLSGKARFHNAEHQVHIRIASHEDIIYLDLCDSAWRVVRITRDGWSIVGSRDCPIKFRRTRGMKALPEPQRDGSLDMLWRLVNVRERDRVIVAGYLTSIFRRDKPFTILALHGEQGSAKTTTARMLCALVDPHAAGLRSEPRDTRDLAIAAYNGWLIGYDNLSHIPTWFSDNLCRLSTGGGFATRELYSDDEEVIFDTMRPVLLNGIEELATRSDLLDRALIISLPTIPENQRRTETEIWRAFDAARPGILGALLDGVSMALSKFENVKLDRLPRMADFAQWATAAEESFGFEAGSFMQAYEGNREDANELALESSPIAAAVRSFMIEREGWTGTAAELLCLLNGVVSDTTRNQRSFPKKPNRLSSDLRRVAPNLRKTGIDVIFLRTAQTGQRIITLQKCS
jgi:hypothetical protein